MSKFFAFISRMKFINRWALMRNTSYESLVSHSHEVAVIALYHDASEIITGDMPTPVKYFNSELKDAYKDVEKKANEKLLNLLPNDLKGDFDDILFYDEKYRKIIKSADKISALIKCEEELKMGNCEFKQAKKTISTAIEKIDCEEANIFLKEFFPYYSLSLDELN